jgi:bifunctional polynucleotide phosphatase/kinase
MSARRTGLKRKAAEQAEVKAKRAKGETDLSDSLKWDYHGEVVKNVCPLLTLTSPTLPGSQKAAGFDIDFTVIKTASGRKFATGKLLRKGRGKMNLYLCSTILVG